MGGEKTTKFGGGGGGGGEERQGDHRLHGGRRRHLRGRHDKRRLIYQSQTMLMKICDSAHFFDERIVEIKFI